MTPIEFARIRASDWECCGGFVARYLRAHGREDAPSRLEITRAWRDKGLRPALETMCALMGLQPCEPGPHCVALAEQEDGGELVGVIDENGFFVTRAFGKMAVRQPRILAAWRVPMVDNV